MRPDGRTDSRSVCQKERGSPSTLKIGYARLIAHLVGSGLSRTLVAIGGQRARSANPKTWTEAAAEIVAPAANGGRHPPKRGVRNNNNNNNLPMKTPSHLLVLRQSPRRPRHDHAVLKSVPDRVSAGHDAASRRSAQRHGVVACQLSHQQRQQQQQRRERQQKPRGERRGGGMMMYREDMREEEREGTQERHDLRKGREGKGREGKGREGKGREGAVVLWQRCSSAVADGNQQDHLRKERNAMGRNYKGQKMRCIPLSPLPMM